MGISICVYNPNICICNQEWEECPCLSDEIWQSTYSTFSKVFKGVKLPDGYVDDNNGDECWSYLECYDLAQRLKNYFPDYSKDYRIKNFIEGLERAREKKLNVVIC